jgi:V/A-type H+-transporting ATPase subunit D
MASVKPTRPEYLRLKKQKQLAEKGHKLLKDKRDGLIREFLSIVKEAIELREKLDTELPAVLRQYRLARARMSGYELANIARSSEARIAISSETENIMGVAISKLERDTQGDPFSYGVLNTPYDLDSSLRSFNDLMPNLMRLAELEYAARKLAEEIEKTRRRVNSLEHVIIPETESNMDYINTKLEEEARQEKSLLLKVKELIEA